MKLPKETKRYCKKCKKHTLHKVGTAKQKSRSVTHPLSRGSRARYEKRGQGVGFGNKGRYGSKPAVKSWKRKTKVTKRFTFIYTCSECHKTSQKSRSVRSGRIEIGEKIAK